MAIVITLISILTVFLLLLFVVFLLSNRRGNVFNQRILAAFLLVNAIYIVNFLLPRLQQQLLINTVHFTFIGNTSGFLFGPLLYFYTKTIAFKNTKVRPISSLHLIPFLVFATYIFITYTIQPLTLKIELTNSRVIEQPLFPYSNYLIMNCHILIYLGFSLHLLYRYRQAIKKIYSSIESLNLSWLNLVLWAFIIMWIIDLIHLLLSISIGLSFWASNLLILASLSINFVFASLILFKSLQHPEVFLESDLKPKYESSPLTDRQLEQYGKSLHQLMIDQKPFLNPTLTINDLSQASNIHPRTISQVINVKLNKNFYDYINTFRIDKSKELLQNPAYADKTILEILYEAGFNSKSVFNQAFKKHTGMTPSQYRILSETRQ